MKFLKSLNISGTKTHISTNFFSDTHALKVLDISNTYLHIKNSPLFSGLTKLTTLMIRDATIINYSKDIFSGLSALTHLDLNGTEFEGENSHLYSKFKTSCLPGALRRQSY